MSAQVKFKNFARNIWAWIAALLVLRRLKSVPNSPLDFDRLTHKPENWLLIMPVEAVAFDKAIKKCKEFLASVDGICMHLLVPFEFRHWERSSSNLKVHPYERQDLFLGRFPRQALIRRIIKLNAAVALDLCPYPTPISLIASGLCGARVRGSLSRRWGDRIFNFLIESRAGNLEDRYRALFAYLT